MANTTFGADLVGTWDVESQCVRIGDPADDTDDYTSEPHQIVITDQNGNRFKGYALPQDPPYTNFYGVIIGNTVYITSWDSISVGRLAGNKIRFVSQNQQWNPPTAPGTCTGIAVKQ